MVFSMFGQISEEASGVLAQAGTTADLDLVFFLTTLGFPPNEPLLTTVVVAPPDARSGGLFCSDPSLYIDSLYLMNHNLLQK